MKKVFILFLLFQAACSGRQDFIRIKGSDTEVNLAVELAENFYERRPDIHVAVSGGGSGLGIASLFNNQTDIANSSRPLSTDEEEMFRAKGIEIVTHVFAEDATAIVVNPEIPLDEIDIGTLAGIFSGEISNWSQLTGTDMPINIYGRQGNSGTHSFIRKKLGIKFSPKAKEMNGNAQILEGIKTDRSGIGYVGAGYLLNISDENPDVKFLKIRESANAPAVSPLDTSAIFSKSYFFQRPLFQIVRAESWEKVKPFIEFQTSGPGEEIIRKSGYYLAKP